MAETTATVVPFFSWVSSFPRRAIIPFRTLCLREPTVAAAGSYSGDVDGRVLAGSAEFLAYLLSDLSVLPSDPRLRVAVAAPEDYESYIGEEDFEATGGSSDRPPSVPQFTEFVDFFEDALRELQRNDLLGGLVLGGTRCVADDATWATTCRTLKCPTLMDVFSTLRNSTKLLRDLQDQSDVEGGGGVYLVCRTFTDIFPGCEFRAFVRAGASGAEVVGICQRNVDQVFDHLTRWSVRESERAFRAMEELLSRDSCKELWRRILIEASSSSPSIIIAVDLVFESETLPIFVLGISYVQQQSKAWSPDEHLSTGDESVTAAGIEFFRLFSSEAHLAAHWLHHQHATRIVFVATEHGDLIADARKVADMSVLPLELQHPELFQHDPATRELIAKVLKRNS